MAPSVGKIAELLINAGKVTWTSDKSEYYRKEKDGSTTFDYTTGNWRYNDNFFGGEPFAGREVVFFKGKAVWMNLYYGWVEKEVTNFGQVYEVLKKALNAKNNKFPVRGPKSFKFEKYFYKNSWQGDLARFTGEEKIHQNSKQIYFARYFGGCVDLRK